MTELLIKGFVQTSLSDWDGKIVSAVFLPYCNFRCPFCQNPGFIEKPQEYETIPVSRIVQFFKEHKGLVDGICITGGEPSLHKEKGLFEFMQTIKGLGLLIKLDTNGQDPDVLKKGIEGKLIDYIAMDIKGPLDERYYKLAGVKVDLEKIKQSIEIAKPYELRTTVVPTLLSAKDIEDMARDLAGAKKIVLQQFVPEHAWAEELKAVAPFSRKEFEEMQKAAKKFVPNTSIRGV